MLQQRKIAFKVIQLYSYNWNKTLVSTTIDKSIYPITLIIVILAFCAFCDWLRTDLYKTKPWTASLYFSSTWKPCLTERLRDDFFTLMSSPTFTHECATQTPSVFLCWLTNEDDLVPRFSTIPCDQPMILNFLLNKNSRNCTWMEEQTGEALLWGFRNMGHLSKIFTGWRIFGIIFRQKINGMWGTPSNYWGLTGVNKRAVGYTPIQLLGPHRYILVLVNSFAWYEQVFKCKHKT